ncbi:MAG: class I SAM-dependent methyltransferase [Limnohabitans sp.]|jgi:SAM-dependent methyltransferase|uniref:class I SAM-dependent methyltransferase n=1 Tax=Limnohabitans sp. TaxID=1907725 RepID=UPI0011D4F6B7|nr:MAG: class I SAM-dependent methyltransferase [Limnohabitans sp.]
MHGTEAPSPWVCRWTPLIRPAGHVLDLACGGGRHMQWLASHGHRVLGVDRSPEALAVAVAFGPTLQADIENGPWPLAGQHFDAVVVTNYLWRPLWPQILESLTPGGVLICETFAQGNETVGRPSRRDFLLAPGELLEVASRGGLRVVAYEDGFLDAPARFVQRMAAVREAPAQDPVRWPLV